MMSETEKKLVEALGRIAMFCDFRPATTTLEEVEHLLAAIDVTASLALREAGAVALAS
jgi:hypothetical protein